MRKKCPYLEFSPSSHKSKAIVDCKPVKQND